MRRRKLLISSLLALAVVISSILLGWSVADEQWKESSVYFLHSAFALYLFLLGARSVRQEDADFHTECIIHLSALTTVAFLLLGATTILPDSPPPFKASNLPYRILWPRSTHEASTQDSDIILRTVVYPYFGLYLCMDSDHPNSTWATASLSCIEHIFRENGQIHHQQRRKQRLWHH
jgi:hypothetical protein